uniref:NADH dehydrogenase subunit 5 n=1 Tax=Meliboeus sinae TaxID=2946727 RepID=UPI00207A3B91|nr:NADH dehydrogenase subunit 5 [Meliboeus sinae]URN73096.1 NADH dehydrogenase subunit 5 [Meliboeus sinae]
MSLSICLIYSFFFLIISVSLFFFSLVLIFMDKSYFLELELLSINSCDILMTLFIDWMSLMFMSFVLFISSMVIYYSTDYMNGDLNLNRFILLVSLFVLSMMLLIVSPNLISILLGWDGLGLVSYCLVIYYQNVKSSSAGLLTALSNRVGDVAILLSIAWMMNFGSWNFIYYLDCMKNDSFMLIITLLVILAAMTKSAQIPFSSWLPAAMAAPTPVSALVHSSTLVTAGVYLLVRFFNALSPMVLSLLLLVSCLTMFMAGLGANFEFDLKKIIALSTLSQLGMMMSIIAFGEPVLGFFHLLSHALFKALLFMCAGSFIHNLGGCQDIRFMGVVGDFMPLTTSFFNICNLSLCGIPFLSGFYSKDLILESYSMGVSSFLIYILFFVSTGLTISYSVRLLFYSILGDFNYYPMFNVSDSSGLMLKGMMGLIFLVVFGGSALSWLLFPFPYMICLPLFMKLMTLMVIFFGSILGYFVYLVYLNSFMFMMGWFNFNNFVSLMWNMPYISTKGVSKLVLVSGSVYLKLVDQGWSEYFGSQNIYYGLNSFSSFSFLFGLNNLKIFLTLLVFWILIILMFI